MKKVIFIAVCVIGIMCFSSCRSSSAACGLADNTTKIQTILNQGEFS
jgi:hypothetical protein